MLQRYSEQHLYNKL